MPSVASFTLLATELECRAFDGAVCQVRRGRLLQRSHIGPGKTRLMAKRINFSAWFLAKSRHKPQSEECPRFGGVNCAQCRCADRKCSTIQPKTGQYEE